MANPRCEGCPSLGLSGEAGEGGAKTAAPGPAWLSLPLSPASPLQPRGVSSPTEARDCDGQATWQEGLPTAGGQSSQQGWAAAVP